MLRKSFQLLLTVKEEKKSPMAQAEINILKNPRDKNFTTVLSSVVKTADEENVVPIFQSLLSIFNPKNTFKLTPRTGNSILSAILALMQRQSNSLKFISEGCLNNLPYGQQEYADIIFDIFSTLIKSDINVFDDENQYVEKFELQIAFNPQKALTIIAIHASNFKYIVHPWNLTDLLISQCDVFLSSNECSTYHLNLLSYLCNEFPVYRKHRTTQCWSLLSQLLDSEKTDILNQVYSILTKISHDNSEISKCFHFLPIERVVAHLNDPSLVESVLLFIGVCSTNFISYPDLIKTLIKISSTDPRAAMILMQLSNDESNALIMMSEDSWISRPSPSFLDTMKIVFCCLSHQKVRALASKSKRLLSLLVKASDTTKPSILLMILGICQKVPLSKSRVFEMNKYGLLKNIIRAANGAGDNIVSDKAMYEIFQIVANVAYVNELLEICKLASQDIIYHSDLYDVALLFILDAIKYEQCIQQLKSTNLIHHFFKLKTTQRKTSENPKNAKVIQQIIKRLDEIGAFDEVEDFEEEEEEEDEYEMSDFIEEESDDDSD